MLNRDMVKAFDAMTGKIPMDDEAERLIAEYQAMEARRSEMAAKIVKADPKISPITAMVIASDRQSAERATRLMDEGMTFKQAQRMVGSYARLDWTVGLLEKGRITIEQILPDLAYLWSGSDPDDTDPRFLRLWVEAWEHNGRKYIRDVSALPRGKTLNVYRGQDDGATIGIAWSLDRNIAEKFARGAATRQHDRGGVVYEGVVRRSKVLGYMTQRGESEIILNPFSM